MFADAAVVQSERIIHFRYQILSTPTSNLGIFQVDKPYRGSRLESRHPS
jgi:hypothetical protein